MRRRAAAAMRAGVALASGWPEMRIGDRLHQRADAAGRAVLARPVDRHEQRCRGCWPSLTQHAQDRRAVQRSRPAPACPARRPRRAASSGCISTNGSAMCAARRGRQARARHGVPLVAHAARVEHERPSSATAPPRAAAGVDGDEARRGRRREELAVGEQALGALAGAAHRPLDRRERVELRRRRCRPGRRCRRRAARRSRSPTGARARERCRRPSDRRRRRAQPSRARHLRQDPPVGPRLAGRRQERALARDAPLGVGDGAVLLAPGRGRQAHVREVGRVVGRRRSRRRPAARAWRSASRT